MSDNLPCVHCSTETLKVRHFMPGQCPNERKAPAAVPSSLDLEAMEGTFQALLDGTELSAHLNGLFRTVTAEVRRLRSVSQGESPESSSGEQGLRDELEKTATWLESQPSASAYDVAKRIRTRLASHPSKPQGESPKALELREALHLMDKLVTEYAQAITRKDEERFRGIIKTFRKVVEGSEAPAPAALPEHVQRKVEAILAWPELYKGFAFDLAEWVKNQAGEGSKNG